MFFIFNTFIPHSQFYFPILTSILTYLRWMLLIYFFFTVSYMCKVNEPWTKIFDVHSKMLHWNVSHCTFLCKIFSQYYFKNSFILILINQIIIFNCYIAFHHDVIDFFLPWWNKGCFQYFCCYELLWTSFYIHVKV